MELRYSAHMPPVVENTVFLEYLGIGGEISAECIAQMPGTEWSHLNPVAFADEKDEK